MKLDQAMKSRSRLENEALSAQCLLFCLQTNLTARVTMNQTFNFLSYQESFSSRFKFDLLAIEIRNWAKL